MSLRPSVLIIDDGELDDVASMLEQLGIDPVRMAADAIEEGWLWPSRLLVVTARNALDLRLPDRTVQNACVPIAIMADTSPTLEIMLRRNGFSYLVRRPFHPQALQLLLSGVLFGEHEKRSETRLAAGCEVSLRSGFWRGKAVLAEVSLHGCRLLAMRAFVPTDFVSIRIQCPDGGGRPLSLRGRVIRCGPLPPKSLGYSELAVAFEGLALRTQDRLKEMLAVLSEGLACLAPEAVPELAGVTTRSSGGSASTPAQPATNEAPLDRDPEPSLELPPPETPRAPAENQRRGRRIDVKGEVLSLGAHAETREVLVGCDLSLGGIRVEPHPSISIGQRLRLALHDPVTKRPLRVDAEVIREDRDKSLGLRFIDLDEVAALQIQLLTRTGVGALDLTAEHAVGDTDPHALHEPEDSPSRGAGQTVEPSEPAPVAAVCSEPRADQSARVAEDGERGWDTSEAPEQPREFSLCIELTEAEIEELEARAEDDLRSKGNYVSYLILRYLRRGETETGPAPRRSAPNEKRVRYEIHLDLTDEDRSRLTELADAELRSVSNFVAKLIAQELSRISNKESR